MIYCSVYSFKIGRDKFGDLAVIYWFFIPFRPSNQRARSNCWKGLPLVFYVQPFGFPFDYFATKLIRDIHFFLPLSKLKACTTYYI